MSLLSNLRNRIQGFKVSGILGWTTLAVALALPQFIHSAFILRLMAQVCLYTLLVTAQNVITGYAGMLSLGQAAFYGIGAYTSAILAGQMGFPWPVALVCAGLVACAFGILLGFPCVRVGSDYLTLMTVGFSQISIIIFLNWMSVTRGPMGLTGISPPRIGSFVVNTSLRYYYVYFVIAVVGFLAVRQLVSSKIGRAFIAIREDEIAAASMGVNIAYYKVLAFGIGAFLAGISGSMLAHFILFVGPSSFTVDEAILHMQMAILGGLGSIAGPILGAVTLTILPQIFQAVYRYRMLLNGVLVLALMIWRPQGILGSSAAGAALQDELRRLCAPVFGGKRDGA